MACSLVQARSAALPAPGRIGGLRWITGFAALCVALAGATTPARAADTVTHWVMPVIPAAPADRPLEPAIFGTVPLPLSPRPTSTRWAKLMHASLAQPALVALAQGAADLPPAQQLAYVQAAVNHAVHSPAGTYDCSEDGYWAPAGETLARGLGDCFDIAIAKLEALRLLGLPDTAFYLTTGRVGPGAERGKGRETVALLVRLDSHFALLTETSDAVIDEGTGMGTGEDGISGFAPVITYGVGMTWLHGRIVSLAALGK